jgi:glycerol uptake facilitator-like aquaporin
MFKSLERSEVKFSELAVEFFATFLRTAAVVLSIIVSFVLFGAQIGIIVVPIVYAASFYLLMRVKGSNFGFMDPLLTVLFGVIHGIKAKRVLLLFLADIIGGFFAGLVLYFVLPSSSITTSDKLFKLATPGYDGNSIATKYVQTANFNISFLLTFAVEIVAIVFVVVTCISQCLHYQNGNKCEDSQKLGLLSVGIFLQAIITLPLDAIGGNLAKNFATIPFASSPTSIFEDWPIQQGLMISTAPIFVVIITLIVVHLNTDIDGNVPVKPKKVVNSPSSDVKVQQSEQVFNQAQEVKQAPVAQAPQETPAPLPEFIPDVPTPPVQVATQAQPVVPPVPAGRKPKKVVSSSLSSASVPAAAPQATPQADPVAQPISALASVATSLPIAEPPANPAPIVQDVPEPVQYVVSDTDQSIAQTEQSEPAPKQHPVSTLANQLFDSRVNFDTPQPVYTPDPAPIDIQVPPAPAPAPSMDDKISQSVDEFARIEAMIKDFKI